MLKFLYKYFKINKKNLYCPFCNQYFKRFKPLLKIFKVDIYINSTKLKFEKQNWETLNIKNYYCPKCGASDKERLYYLYLKDIDRNIKVIHFAPEIVLSNWLKTLNFKEYHTADLHMNNVDFKLDLCDMKIIKNEYYDLVICSHILEHIDDDEKALKEIYRILSPTGQAIIMVPILLNLESTYENKNIVSEKERLKNFGQIDHIRIYSKKDFKNKLIKTKFQVIELGINYFSKEIFNKYGITEQSILYIVKK